MQIDLDDTYLCNVSYFSRYKETPFFIKIESNITVKVSDVEDIRKISDSQLLSYIDIKSFDLLGLSTLDCIDVSYDGKGVYNIDVQYTYASIKCVDYNGNFDEIKVPISSYSDWTSSFGKDWSILMLNDTENHYFKYSNDIELENLYGFFSVAIFKERVTDLNYYFQNYSSDGCKTVFESCEVKGSDIYKFCSNLSLPITGFLGRVIMGVEELIDSSSSTYYSYFFYLDGSSSLNYLAINGADDYDDNSSSIENFFEDVIEYFNNSSIGKGIKILLIVFFSLLFLFVIIFFINKIVNIFKNNKRY